MKMWKCFDIPISFVQLVDWHLSFSRSNTYYSIIRTNFDFRIFLCKTYGVIISKLMLSNRIIVEFLLFFFFISIIVFWFIHICVVCYNFIINTFTYIICFHCFNLFLQLIRNKHFVPLWINIFTSLFIHFPFIKELIVGIIVVL